MNSLQHSPPKTCPASLVSRHWYKDWEWPDQEGMQDLQLIIMVWLDCKKPTSNQVTKSQKIVWKNCFTCIGINHNVTVRTDDSTFRIQPEAVSLKSRHKRQTCLVLNFMELLCLHFAYLLQHTTISSFAMNLSNSHLSVWTSALSATPVSALPQAPNSTASVSFCAGPVLMSLCITPKNHCSSELEPIRSEAAGWGTSSVTGNEQQTTDHEQGEGVMRTRDQKMLMFW